MLLLINRLLSHRPALDTVTRLLQIFSVEDSETRVAAEVTDRQCCPCSGVTSTTIDRLSNVLAVVIVAFREVVVYRGRDVTTHQERHMCSVAALVSWLCEVVSCVRRKTGCFCVGR